MSHRKTEVESRLSMLVSGLGTVVVDLGLVKSAIQEIDAKLDTNALSLQENWAELSSICNKSLEPIKENPSTWLNTKDAIQLLTGPSIQSQICPSEQIVLNCFLNNVIQAIERNAGHEEAILQDLVQFCSEQGILLPYSLPSNENPTGTSAEEAVSINSTNELWDAIRSKLSKGLWNAMINMKHALTNQHQNQNFLLKRIDLLQSLSFLYPVDHVWKGYKHFRQQHVERYITTPELLAKLEMNLVVQYKDAPSNAIILAKLGRAFEIMILEDTKTMEGFFSNKALSFKWFYEVYLEKFAVELKSVLQAYREEKRSSAERRGSSRSTHSMSIHGDDLVVYKLCFLATLSLEMTVVKMLECHEAFRRGRSQNVLRSCTSSPSPSGRTQLPKLTQKLSKESVAFIAWTGMPPQFGASQSDFQTPPSTSQQSSLWTWREEFKHVISRISAAVSENIKLGCDSSLQEQNEVYTATKTLQVVHLQDELVGGQDDYPICIAKSCSVIMAKGDEVLPLASSAGGRLFHVVRSSFVDTFDSCLKTYFSSVMKVITDFPKSCGIEALYILLSSSVFVRNHLAHYDEVIGTEPRRPFAVLHRQYSELVESLTNQIINYHSHIITTVILQDAESHNWSDQRPFFEDERCSFSIQMWNYHFQGLHHDLWKYCPPIRAQTIFTNLLHQSLLTLTLRYGRVVPSYNRVKQLRHDITALLLSCLSFLWASCQSVPALLDPDYSEAPIPSIHNLCSCLLACMTVVSCPLDQLCSSIMDKKKERKQSVQNGGRTDWLSWICPEVLRSHEGSLGALPDRQAMYVLFKIIISQPAPNWPMVLQALLFRSARLPVTIVKYGGFLKERMKHYLSSIGKPLPEVRDAPHIDHNRWFKDSSPPVGSQAIKSSDGLVSSLYYLLFQCTRQTTGLVNFLMALVSREDSLKLFESASTIKTLGKNESPVWLNCILDTLQPYVTRFLGPSLKRLCQQDNKGAKSFNFTAMSTLPCGCPSKRSTKSVQPKSKTEIIYAALRDLITNLTNSLNALPSVIFQFFSRFQESLHRKSIDTSNRSAGIKILAYSLYRWLTDPDLVTAAHCAKPTPSTMKTIQVFGEVVWSVLTNHAHASSTGSVDDPNLPIDVEGMLRSNRNWLMQKVHIINAQIIAQEYDEYQTESIHDEISDLHYKNTATALLQDRKGGAALWHVYHFLTDNKHWLMNLILIPGHILPPEPPRNQSLTSEPSSFNPLQKHALIGECAFDQDKIASFPFDWEALLRTSLCMSPSAVKRLVFNRFEMQTDAYLEDAEKASVQKLRTFYGVEELTGEIKVEQPADKRETEK